MGLIMSDSYFFVQPGEKAFRVATNLTNYLELGSSGQGDYYFEARVENGDFLITASIWEPSTSAEITIIDNFPSGPPWTRQMLPNGWRIVSPAGDLLLSLELPDRGSR